MNKATTTKTQKPRTFYFYFLRLKEDKYGDMYEECVDSWRNADYCEICPQGVDFNDQKSVMEYGIEVGSFLATLGRVADYECIDGIESGMTIHRAKPGIHDYPCNAKEMSPEMDIA